MRSHWDLGKRPPDPRSEAAYQEVSTFDTPEAAASKAQALGLGNMLRSWKFQTKPHAHTSPRQVTAGCEEPLPNSSSPASGM